MYSKQTYPNIDMEKTGKRIRSAIESVGYTPKMIQEYLHLSCVQPIYRWYKGLILPSVDHLLMLSELLDIHMEDLLVKKDVISKNYNAEDVFLKRAQKRFMKYYRRISQLVA